MDNTNPADPNQGGSTGDDANAPVQTPPATEETPAEGTGNTGGNSTGTPPTDPNQTPVTETPAEGTGNTDGTV